jgi:putative transposase
VFIPSREPWRNGTIEHFNDTFDKRFFRQERFTGLEHLSERASAFACFHNTQHRYSATHGRAPDESSPAGVKRAPRAAEQIPTGWPKDGKVEFIRFIRSDHRLRVLGRAIPMPDSSAYQYVTATLDLSLTDQDNLLISDTDGQLLTTARLPQPHRR